MEESRDLTTKRKKINQKSLFIMLGIGFFALLLYFFVPAVKYNIDHLMSIFMKGDIKGIRNYILAFGILAPIVSMLLMMFQSVMAPLPAFVITFANAMVFGWVKGAFYSWLGAMLGATLCFYIAKFLGRPVTVKLISETALNKMDHFFEEYGSYTILICRLVPFISFDVVSYAAGLTDISLLAFLVATGLGQLPATLVYSFVGGSLDQGAQMILYGLLSFCLLIAISFMAKKVLMKKKSQKIGEKR